jgi:hypothetical protein
MSYRVETTKYIDDICDLSNRSRSTIYKLDLCLGVVKLYTYIVSIKTLAIFDIEFLSGNRNDTSWIVGQAEGDTMIRHFDDACMKTSSSIK